MSRGTSHQADRIGRNEPICVAMAVVGAQACPACGAPLTLDPEQVTWCDECSWNVGPELEHDKPRGRLERVYAEAGRRAGNALADEIIRGADPRPRVTLAVVAAGALAVAVTFVIAAMIAGGV